jgi:predicted dehydrogenase
MALLRPARAVPEAAIVAVAARDPARAEAFARKHGIPRVLPSYDALLGDPDVDAIYNPLPNSAHCEWTIKALRAGKHVLCEKPLAANAAEAAQMADAARATGRVLVEAFHWRHHPLAAELRRIVASGELGAIRHVEATFCVPLPLPNDIRYQWALAGGATMDTGCYAISLVRHLSGMEPIVESAQARLLKARIDRWMRAELRFPDGATGRITCALLSSTLLKIQALVRGDRGTLHVFNPIAPHFFHRVRVRTDAGRRAFSVPGDATYTLQLRDFVAACRGAAPRWGPDDAVANMRVVDAVYTAAGLEPRGT